VSGDPLLWGSFVKEYKVMTQKDRWFAGKFEPLKIEEALNAYAAEGWRLAAAATATFPAFFSGGREELIMILERERPS
jgi:hypothetical protein